MRNPVPLLSLALIAWLLFGAFFYQQNCCSGVATGLTSSMLIKDGATVIASHPNNLRFGLSSNQAIILPEIKAEFEKVAGYLGKNPNKSLALVGQYGAEEKYQGALANLGVARAEDIKKYILGLGLGVTAAQITTSGAVNNELVVDGDEVLDGIRYNFKTLAVPSKTISISDASAFTESTNDNLVFNRDGFKYNAPLSDKLTAVYTNTAAYLKAHPDRSIRVTGLYGEKEKNTSAFPSLGLARANGVKDILLGLGVPAKQIDMQGKMLPTLVFNEDELIGGIDYSFFAMPKEADDRLPRVEKMLKANPLTLYFQTNASELNLSATQRQYFADLIYYLDNKPRAKVKVVGHTDDRGDLRANVRLGRKRGEFVKVYLGENGIPAKKVSVISKGPDEPIDTNETREGRQKNRRVEVSIN